MGNTAHAVYDALRQQGSQGAAFDGHDGSRMGNEHAGSTAHMIHGDPRQQRSQQTMDNKDNKCAHTVHEVYGNRVSTQGNHLYAHQHVHHAHPYSQSSYGNMHDRMSPALEPLGYSAIPPPFPSPNPSFSQRLHDLPTTHQQPLQHQHQYTTNTHQYQHQHQHQYTTDTQQQQRQFNGRQSQQPYQPYQQEHQSYQLPQQQYQQQYQQAAYPSPIPPLSSSPGLPNPSTPSFFGNPPHNPPPPLSSSDPPPPTRRT